MTLTVRDCSTQKHLTFSPPPSPSQVALKWFAGHAGVPTEALTICNAQGRSASGLARLERRCSVPHHP